MAITNNASKEDAERLVERVTAIRSMSPEELANAFRQQLLDPNFGEKGGAGLGMLQIARKVGQSIQAEITPTLGGDYICTSQVTTILRPR